jgi:hypothetical protein
LPAEPSLNAVVCHYLQAGGRPEEVYPKIRPIMNQARFAPPEPLLQLAGIGRFKLFVTLTFDSLLAAAIDQVRTAGRALELAYSPKNAQDLPGPLEELRQPVVYHLFGKLSSQPDFVITEEDMLEFLHHMQPRSVAEHLFDALRDNHLLFIGCAFPDWLSRFLLRITKSRQLSLGRTEMEYLVGSLTNRDSDLVVFLRLFSRQTKIASCSPTEFVRELSARYESRTASSAASGSAPNSAAMHLSDSRESAAGMKPGAIFISYTHEDQAAALRLRDFLENEAGIDDVWIDERRLEAGDDWDLQIRRNIKNCSYFMPVISAASTRRLEGYFRREWRWASERAMDFADSVPFIIPVVIDDTPEDAENVPDRFSRWQWMRLPSGTGNEEFRRRMITLIRDYRKRTHE